MHATRFQPLVLLHLALTAFGAVLRSPQAAQRADDAAPLDPELRSLALTAIQHAPLTTVGTSPPTGRFSLVVDAGEENDDSVIVARVARAQLPDGEEAMCVNCADTPMFVDWAELTMMGVSHRRTAGPVDGPMRGKHPNAPGYKRWAAAKQAEGGAVLLSRNVTTYATGSQLNVTEEPMTSLQLTALRPRMQELWHKRRLILGAGPLHLSKRMDFVQTLVHLGREAPILVPEDCGIHGSSVPQCGGMLSGRFGLVAGEGELHSTVEAAFGKQFVADHTFNAAWGPQEQREHVSALLKALKQKYTFYNGLCFAHSQGTQGCDDSASSDQLGRIACTPEEDGVKEGCVYAEVRRCGRVACRNGGYNVTGFFEYARLHGPVALFNTRRTRNSVMGQCEEFTRAGLSLFASLGSARSLPELGCPCLRPWATKRGTSWTSRTTFGSR